MPGSTAYYCVAKTKTSDRAIPTLFVAIRTRGFLIGLEAGFRCMMDLPTGKGRANEDSGPCAENTFLAAGVCLLQGWALHEQLTCFSFSLISTWHNTVGLRLTVYIYCVVYSMSTPTRREQPSPVSLHSQSNCFGLIDERVYYVQPLRLLCPIIAIFN